MWREETMNDKSASWRKSVLMNLKEAFLKLCSFRPMTLNAQTVAGR